MRDDLRPHGTVEVVCGRCGWSFWLDPLDPSLQTLDAPMCARCSGHETGEKAEPHGRPPTFNPGRS